MIANSVRTIDTSSSVIEPSLPVCPICQGTKFGAAPNGRLSKRGLPPRCLSCKSLERNRAGRTLMETLRDRARFKESSLLQFGEEGIVAKGWFKTAESAGPIGSQGALDPTSIAKADGSVDFVISSHVITRVEDHRAALREIGRILSPRGLAYISYPSPNTRQKTMDWGYADPARNGEYRILGTDFEEELAGLATGIHVAGLRIVDPVTNDDDLIYLFMRDFFWMRRIITLQLDARFLDH